MTVHVAPGTLTDPAVAVYSAPSCSGPFTQIACNDNGTGCESSPRFARVQLTGLTVGQTYYVAVGAGAGGGVGDYTLAIWETGGTAPSQFGQDCDAIAGNPASGPLPVCSSTFSVGAPGFLGSGFTCDLPYPASGCPASCLTSGERNIAWFRIPINANGNLSFSITPSTNVDYDWILYRIDNVANPCQAIRNGTLNPVRCSYDAPPSCNSSYSTGVACGTPACASGTCEGVSGQGWLACLSVNAGEIYLLGISNFSTTTFPGFSLDFGTSPIDYSAVSVRVWTGGAGTTAWNSSANWGGCTVPNSCTQDVLIYGGAANQPVIAAAETWTVRDITIAAGASLTVNGTLDVCGHLTVNGELQGTGWIVFTGGAAYPVQEIRGVLTGATQYIPNLRVNRSAAGQVRLMTNVQVRSSVEVALGADNTLNLNGYRLFVGGNVVVGDAAATLQAPSNSFLIFNGAAPQTYTDPGSDPLFNVEVAQSPPSTVTLNNTMRILGGLTLTSGRIVAPVSVTREVRVENPAPGAVSPGNPNSFVVGYLRRFVSAMLGGAYDFPLGLNSPVRYARINLNFANAPGMHNLLGTFTGWGGTPPTPSGTPVTECGANYGTCDLLDNGYWTITGWQNDLTTPVTTSTAYTATLYNTGYTPCSGAVQWGVLKNDGSANDGAAWFIQNPGCHANTAPGAPGVVSRPGMSGFSHFATGQSTQPLPVVLQVFSGEVLPDGSHRLYWSIGELEGARVSQLVLEAGVAPDRLSPLVTLERGTLGYVRSNPPYGSTFYRLRIQVEGGTEIYSGVVELRRGLDSAPARTLEAFPNPTTGELTVRFLAQGAGTGHLLLYNTLGQRVFQTLIAVEEAGLVELKVSLRDLPAGVYLLAVEQGGTFQQCTVRKE